MSSGTYSIVNLLDMTRYIGSSIDLESRRTTHFSSLKKGTHCNRHLQSAFSKYGEDNFYFSVIETVDKTGDVIGAEQEFLDLAMAAGWRLYNQRLIATSNMGLKHSPEALAKMSAANKGRRISDAHRNKLRLFRLGKKTGPMSEAQKRKISATRIGIEPWNKGKKYKLRHVEGRTHPMWARRAAITHCPKGHIYDAKNTYIAKNRQRCCRECGRLRMQQRRTADRKTRGVEGQHKP